MLESIIFSTLGELATGILLFIALIPPSAIGKGFGRFHTILALIFWILAAQAKFSLDLAILAALLLLTCFFATRNLFYYLFLIPSLAVSFYVLLRPDVSQLGLIDSLLIHVPPILVLGASSVAMLLGHWYLVAPKLSIVYLKTLTVGLILSILIRSGLLIDVLITRGETLSGLHFYDLYGIFFLQRVVLGLLLTLILSFLTYFCVRIRSTQSATGILYVVVVFCLIGEVIGSYLFVKTGVSL